MSVAEFLLRRPIGYVPEARVKRVVVTNGLNDEVNEQLPKLRAELKPFQDAVKILEDDKELAEKDADGKLKERVTLTERRRKALKSVVDKSGKRAEELVAEIAALSGARIRLSPEATAAVRATFDVCAAELLQHAFEQSLECNKRMSLIEHMRSGDVGSLNCYPLISKLPSFQADPAEPDTLFSHYINQMAQDLSRPPKRDAKGELCMKQQENKNKNMVDVVDRDCEGKFANMHASGPLKNIISQLLVELAKRISHAVSTLIEATDGRTINQQWMVSILRLLVSDGAEFKYTFKSTTKKVRDAEAVEVLRLAAKTEGKRADYSEVEMVDKSVHERVVEYSVDSFAIFHEHIQKMAESK